jgi:hypothetical protein
LVSLTSELVAENLELQNSGRLLEWYT